ncbi:unnamed protein product [Pleuronectes platessa]|uniref:Uncharacterized protein n=1 Tax=Pleuronectes platessa TaxID=8262 RepID=A0A9N7VS40_PLEPL|nr:unnamed protein product [Pleuronectes platessa]
MGSGAAPPPPVSAPSLLPVCQRLGAGSILTSCPARPLCDRADSEVKIRSVFELCRAETQKRPRGAPGGSWSGGAEVSRVRSGDYQRETRLSELAQVPVTTSWISVSSLDHCTQWRTPPLTLCGM